MILLIDSQLDRVLEDWELQNNTDPRDEEKCLHRQGLIKTSRDGTKFFKCSHCKEEFEI